MQASPKPFSPPFWFTVPIGLLLLIAAGSGLFIRDLYRDNPYFATQAVAQDFISLAVALPVLAVTAVLGGRGSLRAWLIWMGCLAYLIYTYVVAAFDDKFNALFLVYVALLGCSLYALIWGLATADLAALRARFSGRAPVRAVSAYLAALAVLFYSLWLKEIIPALLAGAIPQSIRDNGTPTNAVHVLDMAWILPAFGLAAVNLWRRKALGYALAGILLTYGGLLILAVLSMVVFMLRAGFSVSAPQVVIFGLILAFNLGMLIGYLKYLQPAPRPATA